LAFGVAASAIAGCGFLKKPGAADAGADAEVDSGLAVAPSASGPTAAPTAPAITAANESQVTRYPGEQAEPGPLTLDGDASLRTAAPTGDLVLLLKRGTEVEKVSEYQSYYLIQVEDPKDPTRKLLGWVPATAFSNGKPVAVVSDAGVKPAVVTVTDGGAKPAVVVDAGAKPVVVDAGAKPVTPAVVKPLDVKKVNNACPAGYGSCGAVCRLSCKADADCGLATAHCTGGFCIGPNTKPCGQ